MNFSRTSPSRLTEVLGTCAVMILTEGLKILFLILLDPTGSLTFTLLMSGLVTILWNLQILCLITWILEINTWIIKSLYTWILLYFHVGSNILLEYSHVQSNLKYYWYLYCVSLVRYTPARSHNDSDIFVTLPTGHN